MCPCDRQELAQLADGRPLLLAGLFLPVLGWVAFNIAGPAFRQLNSMRGNDAPAGKKKRAVTAALTGLSAAALMAAPEHADAAQVCLLSRLAVYHGQGLPGC